MTHWIVTRNRISIQTRDRRKVAIWMSIVVVIIVVSSWALMQADLLPVDKALGFIHEHAHWAAILAVLQSAITVVKRRRELMLDLSHSWLASTPRAAATLRSFVALKTFWAPAWQLAVATIVLLAMQLIGHTDPQIAKHVIVMVAGASAGGSILGWAWPGKKPAMLLPGSRYVPKGRGPSVRNVASFDGLSRWPVAHAFAWATPDTVRWPLMAAMLSVTAGSSATAGIAVITFWMLILYMVTLLNSTLRVAREAAQWLRATPLSFVQFAAAIAGRSFVHQLFVSLLIAALLSADRMTFVEASLLISPWIAFVVLACSTTIAHSFRSANGARMSIAIAAATIAAFEIVQRGVAIPLSLLVSAWHLRRGMRLFCQQGVKT